MQNVSQNRILLILHSIPPPFPVICRPFIVVKCCYLFHFAWHPAWFWLISVKMSYSNCSCSPCLNVSVYYITLPRFGDCGHILAFALVLRLRFAPAMRTLDALKHKTTHNPLLANRPGKSCLVSKNSLFTFFTGISLSCTISCKVWAWFQMCFPSAPVQHTPISLCFLLVTFIRYHPCKIFRPPVATRSQIEQ